MNASDYVVRLKAHEGKELYHAFEMKEGGVIFLSFRPQRRQLGLERDKDTIEWLGAHLARETPGNLHWYNSYEAQLSVLSDGLYTRFVGPLEVTQLVCTHEEAREAEDLLQLIRDRVKVVIDLDKLRQDPALAAAAETLLKALRLVSLKSQIAGSEYSLKCPSPDEPSYKALDLAWLEIEDEKDDSV